jgi:putative endonuclease
MTRPPKKPYYFYILRCQDQTLYCGITTDLKKREQMHNSGKGSAYVRSRGGGWIVYSETIHGRGRALQREAAVKKLSRTQKLQLIKNARS